jgi:hypothetical protein
MSEKDRQEPVWLMVWDGDPCRDRYLKLSLPKNWNIHVGREEWCGEKMNRLFELFPREPFYGFLSDDVELETPDMLAELGKSAVPNLVVYPDDGVHGPTLCTHPVIGGDLVRAMRCWAHPLFPQDFLDLIIYDVGDYLGLLYYRPEFRIKVRHPKLGTAPMDATYHKGQKQSLEALSRYVKWKNTERFTFLKGVQNGLKTCSRNCA